MNLFDLDFHSQDCLTSLVIYPMRWTKAEACLYYVHADGLNSMFGSSPFSPLEMCAVGSLQFLFVFYRPDRRENVRS